MPVLTLIGSPMAPARASHAWRSVSKLVPSRQVSIQWAVRAASGRVHCLRCDLEAVRAQARRRPAEPFRMRRQIDTDPHHHNHVAHALLAFAEDADTLCVADQDVVGPLQPQPRQGSRSSHGLDRVVRRQPRQQRKLVQGRRRTAEPLHQRVVEIAGLGGPGPAGAALATPLPPGHHPDGAGSPAVARAKASVFVDPTSSRKMLRGGKGKGDTSHAGRTPRAPKQSF